MRITCPLCGERPLEEFHYHGDAAPLRPRPGMPTEAWSGFVYLRDNPCGLMREHWRHTGGCGAWLLLERDTANHTIASARLAQRLAREAAQ